ncbi:MAG: GNAT family N-acetyltransferase [candidate division KSB1 bacterium]|nr:GNAT family N-acetyltransferase [candidate division KSB1 bacterium]MDZ7335946.1 GNAT family N-acetyltransferase [candidate division KSB1 bacterium]MDZ7357740.1 GNAT family N-acetyltransferase [candidate division KSB1 bacterium]MDZ7399863.1 GNAT family N-acetyltransferase [candidate division KSB1 bacterium]
MNSSFEIGQAQPSDIRWIAAAQVAMAAETEGIVLDPTQVVQGVRYIFDHPERGFYILARADQQPIGCLLILKEWSDWRNGDVWWIHSVYVDPSHRKRGVFKQMFQHIEQLARSSQIRGVRLYVDKRNVSAQKVYKKLGMTNEHYELFEKMF